MFIDKVDINIKGGNGGNGMVAFRREKYVPNGGPAGGDGGKGGSVIFRVDEGLRTLMDLRFQRHFQADNGEHGRSKSQHGAGAKDKVILVPPGTVIKDIESKIIVADLVEDGQEVIAAKGGRGGKGNIRFATATNPAPQIAEKGEPGEERSLQLELKLLADVGLIGFPSVGKSTLLSVLSSARPKIGDYHFTTLTPNLGVVYIPDGRSFVLADMPGIIEGAHEGAGLGHQFLKHIERTKVLAHVIDVAGLEGRDPCDDFVTINNELEQYSPELSTRPQIVVANKIDLASPQAVRELEDKLGKKVYGVSAATQEGVKQLAYTLAELLEEAERNVSPVRLLEQDDIVYKLRDSDQGFEIKFDGLVYHVEGSRVEKLLNRTNFDYHDSVLRFSRTIQRMGIEDALRTKGAQNGDTVVIGGMQFVLSDSMFIDED